MVKAYGGSASSCLEDLDSHQKVPLPQTHELDQRSEGTWIATTVLAPTHWRTESTESCKTTETRTDIQC